MTITPTDREVIRQWLTDRGVSSPNVDFLDAIIRLLRGIYDTPQE